MEYVNNFCFVPLAAAKIFCCGWKERQNKHPCSKDGFVISLRWDIRGINVASAFPLYFEFQSSPDGVKAG